MSTIKLVLATILFIAIGFGIRYGFRVANGLDPMSVHEDEMQNILAEAKEMFLEKNEAIQTLTANIYTRDGLTILRTKSGEAFCAEKIDALAELADVFGEYENLGTVYNIAVTDTGVYFFTNYSEDGTAGFVWESWTHSAMQHYETVEIVEDWKLFYEIAK